VNDQPSIVFVGLGKSDGGCAWPRTWPEPRRDFRVFIGFGGLAGPGERLSEDARDKP
jgi:hypothetical protein